MSARLAALALAGLTASTSPAAIAQEAPERAPRTEVGSRWAAYGGAAGIGALGFVAGAYAAIEIDDECSDLDCLEPAFYGAAALGTIGLAVGAHLGNGRRGNLLLDLLTAAGIWGLGIGPAIATQSNSAYTTMVFVLVPIAQVLLTTEVERARGRARVRRSSERLSVGLVPLRRAGVALRFSW